MLHTPYYSLTSESKALLFQLDGVLVLRSTFQECAATTVHRFGSAQRYICFLEALEVTVFLVSRVALTVALLPPQRRSIHARQTIPLGSILLHVVIQLDQTQLRH